VRKCMHLEQWFSFFTDAQHLELTSNTVAALASCFYVQSSGASFTCLAFATSFALLDNILHSVSVRDITSTEGVRWQTLRVQIRRKRDMHRYKAMHNYDSEKIKRGIIVIQSSL
jgi:hypothetical protein